MYSEWDQSVVARCQSVCVIALLWNICVCRMLKINVVQIQFMFSSFLGFSGSEKRRVKIIHIPELP